MGALDAWIARQPIRNHRDPKRSGDYSNRRLLRRERRRRRSERSATMAARWLVRSSIALPTNRCLLKNEKDGSVGLQKARKSPPDARGFPEAEGLKHDGKYAA